MQRRWWISCLAFFLYLNVYSQDQSTDLNQLTAKTNYELSLSDSRKVKWMDGRSRNKIVKYNPVNVVFSGLMFCYQKVFSPQLSASCVFAPSCSHFSKQLMREYGLIKGLFLTADRITRCNRVSAADFSPLIVDERTHLAYDDVKNFKVIKR